jgi:hypothetical protein
MSGTIEQAQEGMERADHAAGRHENAAKDHGPRNVAIMIAILAAALALTEMGEKASQNRYLTHHISVSDTWAFFQAKNARATTYLTSADIIDSMPGADAEAHKRAERMRAEAARMNDDPKSGEGRKQLAEKATAESVQRDQAFHIYHQFELATGALQIAIVLASVSIVTRFKALTIAAALIGGVAAVFGLLVATGVA